MADPVFEAFRRKLADVVTVAINEGKRVSAGGGPGCFCPLGCHPISVHKKPCSWAAFYWGIPGVCVEAFIRGFDNRAGGPGPYAELGRLYRARFP